MKKLFAIVMTIVMLCSAWAMAEGSSVTIKDFMVVANEMVMMDLSNIGLSFDVFGDTEDGNGAVRISVEAGDQSVLDLAIALGAEKALLKMSGVDGIYSIANELVEELVPAEAADLLEKKDLSSVFKPEDQAALALLGVKAATAFAAGVTKAEDQDVEGEIYDVTTVVLENEDVKPLMDELVTILEPYSYLLADRGIESITAAYNELNPVLGLEAYLYENDEVTILDAAVFGGIGGQEMGALYTYIEAVETGEDAGEAYLELGVTDFENDYMIALNVAAESTDGSWVPTDDGATIDLAVALEDEAKTQELTNQVMTAVMGALSELSAANETVAALAGMYGLQ